MAVNYPIMYSDKVANLISSVATSQPCPPVIPLQGSYGSSNPYGGYTYGKQDNSINNQKLKKCYQN